MSKQTARQVARLRLPADDKPVEFLAASSCVDHADWTSRRADQPTSPQANQAAELASRSSVQLSTAPLKLAIYHTPPTSDLCIDPSSGSADDFRLLSKPRRARNLHSFIRSFIHSVVAFALVALVALLALIGGVQLERRRRVWLRRTRVECNQRGRFE